MEQTFILIFFTLLLSGIAFLLFYQLRHSKRLEKDLYEKLSQDKGEVLQQQLSDLRSHFNENFLKQLDQMRDQMGRHSQENIQLMQKTNENWTSQFQTSQKTVTDVKTSLVRLEEMSTKIFEVGKDISGLNDILKAPKLRGNLGEYFLKDLLEQIMVPGQFELQYKFKNGQRVDAVVKTADGMVPIDSKFPMESFRRMLNEEKGSSREKMRREFHLSVKERIKEICDSYVRPSEGTLDFALMYIPAENIYYETIIRDDNLGAEGSLSHYATKRHVIPVSPNTLYAYLCTILMGLRRLEIEKHAEEIIRRIQRLNKEFDKFILHYSRIDDKISQLRSHYDDSQKRLGNVQKQMDTIESVGKDKTPGLEEEKVDPLPENRLN